MASFMVTRSLLTRLANHQYTRRTDCSGTQALPAMVKSELQIQCMWKEYFEETSVQKGLCYRTIQCEPLKIPWFLRCNMSRQEIVTGLRLRSGHNPLNKIMYLMKRVESLNCDVCGKEEDQLHIVMDCVGNQDLSVKDSLSEELLCRACAGSACTPLRETIDDTDIMSALRAVTGVTMNMNDRLPKYICSECLTLLRSALTLRRKCSDTDRRLRDTLASNANAAKCYPYSKHNFQLILHKMSVKRTEARERSERALLRRANRQKTKVKKKKKVRNKFKCQPCGLSFPDKDALTSHRLRRSCMRHPCHICGQLVLSLKQHVRVSHGQGSAHKCHVCGKEFPIVARLRSHQLVHEDKFNFYCDMCPYKSKHKYYLVMHMRTHTGEKPYKCTQCDATFVNPSNLNKHRLTHREKQFQCGLCDKSFRTSTALREHHEAAHMNLKHTCKFCGRDFCYKSDLRKHEIRHHNRVKRDYIGGEPTYKQVERLQKQQEAGAGERGGDKWVEMPPAETYNPQVYVYPAQEAFAQQQIVTQPVSSIPIMSANMIVPDPLMKKDDPKQYVPPNIHFFSFTDTQ